MTTPGAPHFLEGTWPSELTHEQVTTFTRWGWTARDWQDSDREVAIRFGPGIVPLDTPTQRNHFTLREWLRNPPTGAITPIRPRLIAKTVRAHGHRLAANVLDVYAAGGSRSFVAVFLAKRPGQTGWPQRDVITGWEITAMAGLTDSSACGWATTGWLNVKVLDRATTATREARVVADRIIAWTDRFGPDAWLYVLAGVTLEEARELQMAGRTPTRQQLQVMAALNGVVLPAGV